MPLVEDGIGEIRLRAICLVESRSKSVCVATMSNYLCLMRYLPHTHLVRVKDY